MNEGNAKQQIVEGIRTNTNILVTVSDNPSVDELSAALGLTLLLNKLEKRATSIFSGKIPPAITFLVPEKTFEGTVDSLRDFIIALDKEKADHLRYKVDGDVVKIFITPYRTTLSDKDLEFSQGDYNVEMVIALGVREQDHLDKALSAHGRILHDATVATVSIGTEPSNMGSIDWSEAGASSLCEMLISLSEALKGDSTPLLDETIATAFLTGIVSATERFSNDRTSSRVMTMAAQLMAAGANQQLIAAKLQEGNDIGPTADRSGNSGETESNKHANTPSPVNNKPKKDKKKKDDNSLKIERNDKNDAKKPSESGASKDEQPAATEEEKPAEEAVAVAAALDQAEPVKDIEQELAQQLAEVAPAIPAPAPTPDDLQKELNETLAVEQSTAPAPEISAVPAPAPEPAPIAELPVDEGMPGFEPLDVPASQPAPASTVSDSIQARPGSDYITPDAPANFDAPVGSIIEGANTTNPDTYVDPFQTPLAPLPDLRDSEDITPVSDEAAQTPAPNGMSSADTPLPPLPPTDLPPLPPLPDMSNTELPPLPPPPPPVFDQPSAQIPGSDTPSGAISSDKLGDIFGDAPAQTTTPSAPVEPPKPGQFQIPKM